MWVTRVQALLAKLKPKPSAPDASTGSPIARWERVATALLIALGLFFRARGVLFGERLELWNDEASWAMRMFERPLAEHLIRPPAYVIFTRLSATLFGYREIGFRLAPWLAGMATPFVATALARHFLRNAGARLFFIATLCLSATAIDFSKEFKQYSIGLLLQLLLAYLALRWADTRQVRDLVLPCAVAAGGLLFSQDVMFLYPGLFLALLLEAFRAKDWKQLKIVVGAGAATVALVLAMFFLVWNRIKKDEAEAHWGGRYDVFYLAGEAKGKWQGGHAAWLAGKYRDMAAVPGSRRDYWSQEGALTGGALETLAEVDTWFWVGLHALGLGLLVYARRARELLLFWSPVLTCTLLNLAGRWPIGSFRTNLFLLAGMSAVAACALDWSKLRESRVWLLAPTLLAILLPIALFERDFHAHKPGAYAAGVLNLLRTLNKQQEPGMRKEREPLYMDTQACQPFKYYTQYHPLGKQVWAELEPRIKPVCGRKSKLLVKEATRLKKKQRAWFLLVNRASMPRVLRVESRSVRYKHTLIEVRKR